MKDLRSKIGSLYLNILGIEFLLMKESGLMRVLFCKIHCPLICFCKPSAAHIYTQGQLKLENTPHVPSSTVVSVASDALIGEVSEAKEVIVQGSKQEAAAINGGRRSCIRKAHAPKEIEKKSVQWVDNLGKELVEIKEFETSETGDTDNEDENGQCFCIIL